MSDFLLSAVFQGALMGVGGSGDGPGGFRCPHCSEVIRLAPQEEEAIDPVTWDEVLCGPIRMPQKLMP